MLNATLIFNAKGQLSMLNDLPPSIRNKPSKLLFIKALYKMILLCSVLPYWIAICKCVCVRVLMNNLKSYTREKSILFKGHN